MGFKRAVGSSDGVNINLKFGEAKTVTIYEVDDDYNYTFLEKRDADISDENCNGQNIKPEGNCNSSGCNGNRDGCGGSSVISARVQLISDCRCVVFTKIGFQAVKQFEKKAISVFDIALGINEALDKIVGYYKKIDGKR